MADSVEKLMTKAIDQYLKLYQNPEDFFSVNKKLATGLRNTTKSIYEINKTQNLVPKVGLPELIIKNFDDEQIWQQLELRNDSSVPNLLNDVARIVASTDTLTFEACRSKDHENKIKIATNGNISDGDVPDSNVDSESDTDTELTRIRNRISEIENDVTEGQGSDSELDFDFNVDDDVDMNDDDDDDDGDRDEERMHDDEGEEEELESEKKQKKKISYKSEVDDKFFKLSELENFLDAEDAKEERRQRRERQGGDGNDENDDVEDDEDDIDMFQNMSSSDEEEGTARNLKYEDFFYPPDEDESSKDKVETSEKTTSKKNVSFSKDVEENKGVKDKKQENPFDSDSDGEDVTNVIGGKKENSLSSYEKRQQKLKAKIAKMEDASLLEKPWQLSGEVIAKARPENSLLEEFVQFEHTTRPAPVITEETTKSLEEIVKQRIKDQSWDDVERKERKKEDPFEYKKKLTLDMEKSKMSLGEIYEQEYLKQQQKEEEDKKDPQHEDIKKMMTSLFLKLDALSNFHYTPKQSVPEVKIVSNLPSIVMEEVAPVGVSDATLLAPEEIQEKQKGEVKGKLEKSDVDRRRERRKKKTMKRLRRIEKEKREKLVEKMKPGLGNKYSKEKALKDLEKQSKLSKNVTVIKENGFKKNVGSSTAFFTQLQEEVTSHINKSKEIKKSKKKEKPSSSKLKL